jgi:hypothetical protein
LDKRSLRLDEILKAHRGAASGEPFFQYFPWTTNRRPDVIQIEGHPFKLVSLCYINERLQDDKRCGIRDKDDSDSATGVQLEFTYFPDRRARSTRTLTG